MKIKKNVITTLTLAFASIWNACSTEDPSPQGTHTPTFFGDVSPIAVPEHMTQLSNNKIPENEKVAEVVQIIDALRYIFPVETQEHSKSQQT